MNAYSPVMRPDPVTVQDLVVLGFTGEQIDKLIALKAAYPFIEYVDSANQWRRLEFLKWRFERGDLQRL
jgi:hypothetical protein